MLNSVSLVLGQAGTGKTTWLVEEVKRLAPRLISQPHQAVLAITRMHGARRRVSDKLRTECAVNFSVQTIHAFALKIANKWRSERYKRPLHPVHELVNGAETAFGSEVHFDQVIREAVRILESETARRVVGQTYPLIIVDELQDCHGSILELIKALSVCGNLLAAADDFQLLDTTVQGCPSIEWIRALEHQGAARIHRTEEPHRFANPAIFQAARAVREGEPTEKWAIPMVSCPKAGPAAWRILTSLLWSKPPWRGSTAVLCTSLDDPFLKQVLESLERQWVKRAKGAQLRWTIEGTGAAEQEKLLAEVLRSEEREIDSHEIAARVLRCARRFSRLRGLPELTPAVLKRHVETAVHSRRAYCPLNPKKLVTTIHGAKNLEFDNVVVLWGYKLQDENSENARRLLYNAVTRAKHNCMVLVLDPGKRCIEDPLLRSLGPPQPAFAKKKGVKRKDGRAR